MVLPDNLQQIANAGLQQMYTDPQHHFNWRVRRELYHQLKAMDAAKGERVHGWLAVLTAEHVLPIFVEIFPRDHLPWLLVRYATKVMQGRIDPQAARVHILHDRGYHGTGIDMLEIHDQTAYNAEYAGTAAYKALVETTGHQDLLDDVETLRRGPGFMTMASSEHEHLEGGSSFNDEDIAHLAAFSDTASAAAIAYACQQERFKLDRKRLRAFWEWWVAVALPEAWNRK